MLTITCNLVIEDDGGAVMAGDGHGARRWTNFSASFLTPVVVRTVMIDGAVKIDGSWWIDDAVMAMGLVMTVRSQSGLTEKVGFVGSHYF